MKISISLEVVKDQCKDREGDCGVGGPSRAGRREGHSGKKGWLPAEEKRGSTCQKRGEVKI
jgi:hypothetical protein